MQGTLAQGTLGYFQFADAQQIHCGHHDTQTASNDGAAVFLEAGQTQFVDMPDIQQLQIQVAQLGGGDDAPVKALGGKGIAYGIGCAG